MRSLTSANRQRVPWNGKRKQSLHWPVALSLDTRDDAARSLACVAFRGQLNLHMETGFYITSQLFTWVEGESRSIANRPLEPCSRGGLSGLPRATLGATEAGQSVNSQERSRTLHVDFCR